MKKICLHVKLRSWCATTSNNIGIDLCLTIGRKYLIEIHSLFLTVAFHHKTSIVPCFLCTCGSWLLHEDPFAADNFSFLQRLHKFLCLIFVKRLHLLTHNSNPSCGITGFDVPNSSSILSAYATRSWKPYFWRGQICPCARLKAMFYSCSWCCCYYASGSCTSSWFCWLEHPYGSYLESWETLLLW